MADDELEAIRRARMAQLRGQSGGGGGVGSSGGPSSSLLSNLGASRPQGGGGGGGGGGGRGGGGGDDEEDESAQLAAAEERQRQVLSTLLTPSARERLSRISLVKPQKAQGITQMLIQMAQSGQIRQKVDEQNLIGLLEQVEKAQGQGSAGGAGKITYNRKKVAMDDSDDDFDL